MLASSPASIYWSFERGGHVVPALFHFLPLRRPLRSGAWVSADPATLFMAFGVLGLDSSFDAFEATDLEVFSFFATALLP